jgi:hypothetical protein
LAQTVITTVYVLLIAALTIASANAADDIRTSTSTHYADGGRNGGHVSADTVDEFASLVTEGDRTRPGGAESGSPAGDSPALGRSRSNDFWIYDADVVLFGDDDRDGFFFGIDLLFDADTIWSSATVYAVLYLSLDGGPWNEYAATDDFRIDGATSDDEYVIVTELQSGYPTGDYDILIELYDSVTGEFLTDFGPESSSALGFLPLEDFNRDAPLFDQPVTVSRGGGGGSAGFLSLLALAATGLVRLRRGDRPAG